MAAEELEPLFGGRSQPRIGWLQRTVAQWLSADSGTAGAFQRMLGARRVPDAFWPARHHLR